MLAAHHITVILSLFIGGGCGEDLSELFHGSCCWLLAFLEAITRQSIPKGCFANWQQSQELELLREIRGHYSVGQMWPGSSVLFQALIPRPALSLSLLRHVFDDCFLSSGNGNVFNLSYLYQAQSMNASLYVSSWRNISSYLCQAQWMNAFSRVEMVMYYKVFQICYLYEAHAFPWLMWLQRNG